jgi:uncharacterized protein
MTNAVFLDTVGLLALWNRQEQWHQAAIAAHAPLADMNSRMVTTSAVLLECGNALSRTNLRAVVAMTRTEMAAAGNLIGPTDSDSEEAWAAYAMGQAGAASIVDHISFAVMHRLGLTKAFTNDRHFSAAGFEVLF